MLGLQLSVVLLEQYLPLELLVVNELGRVHADDLVELHLLKVRLCLVSLVVGVDVAIDEERGRVVLARVVVLVVRQLLVEVSVADDWLE